ncbi:hypothetical protein [Streptomyces sp. NPDC126499]|uniref:hypothetical protein n=1 Tax=Streptomyces sp. NPDC126499 TaxID=3155314 RepID=UPI00333200C9
MRRTRAGLATATAAFLGLGATGTATAAAGDVLLPHPGPDGLVWVEEQWGDGGVASGGAHGGLPTVLTVACEGGGTLRVTMRSQETEVADFAVTCPTDTPARGSVTMPPGVVRPGSFTIGVDASSQDVRWAMTVTQPE